LEHDEVKRRLVKPGEKFLFKCIRCDLCCGTGPNVSLTIFDVIRLSYALDVNPHLFLRVYAKVVLADIFPFISLRGDLKGRCVFLGFDDEGNTYCKLYQYRPMKCRLYPLIMRSPSDTTLELDLKCPGVDASDGEPTQIPLKLYKQYSWEVKKHYSIIYRKIMREGKDAIKALDEAIDELWKLVKKENPRWLDPSWLESLEKKS
jgi:Fe-S-cluster containining protein